MSNIQTHEAQLKGSRISDRGAFGLEDGAEFAGVSVPVLYGWIERSDFPCFKSGRRWVIPKDAFIRWMEDRAKERATL